MSGPMKVNVNDSLISMFHSLRLFNQYRVLATGSAGHGDARWAAPRSSPDVRLTAGAD